MLYGWATAACLALATWLFDRHLLTVGGVYLVFSYADAIRTPLDAVNRQLQLLQTVGAALARMRELLAERSRLSWSEVQVQLPAEPPTVRLDGVARCSSSSAAARCSRTTCSSSRPGWCCRRSSMT